MSSFRKAICAAFSVWFLVSALLGVSLFRLPPETSAAWTPIKTSDSLLHEPRGTAEGVYKLAVALGSYRLKDVKAYADEIYRLAPLVGLDPAILIGQSALETGYWKGKFWISSLNPAGIGIYDDYQPHSFYWANGTDAARGHIYHLYTYAMGVPPPGHILYQFRKFTPGVDGAVRLGYAGTRKTIMSLEGSWALMKWYALGLCNKGNEILKFTESIAPTATATSVGSPLPVTGVSASAGNNPSATLDGNASTSWAILGKGSIPASGYVTYDLGAVTQLSSIEWKFRKDGFADNLSIRASTDGASWTTLRLYTASPGTAWQRLNTTASARHIRFFFRNPNADTDIGYLAEVRINGYRSATSTATPTKAPTKAFLSGEQLIPVGSGGSGGASPSKSVRDGSFDSDWRTLSSPAPAKAFVYLDLGGNATITAIRTYLHTANCGRELVIEVSFDKKNWTEVGRGHPDRAGAWQVYSASTVARYVRLRFLNGGADTVLGCVSEFQIWGTGVVLDTPTPTPSATATASRTATPSRTPTSTKTAVPTQIPTSTSTPDPPATATDTATVFPTGTPTETPAPTSTETELPPTANDTETPFPADTPADE